MPHKQIYIIGGGGHGKVAVRAAQLSGIEAVAVYDDDPARQNTVVCGVPVVGPVLAIAAAQALPTFIAIGDNDRRLRWAAQLKLPWATIVHPAAVVDSEAELGAGVLVLAGAVVQIGAQVADHAIINSNAIVEHDCRVGRGAHVSCGACLAGRAGVGEGTLIGVGASILPGVNVGDGSTIGAGAVVTRDVASHVTAVGVPARVLLANR